MKTYILLPICLTLFGLPEAVQARGGAAAAAAALPKGGGGGLATGIRGGSATQVGRGAGGGSGANGGISPFGIASIRGTAVTAMLRGVRGGSNSSVNLADEAGAVRGHLSTQGQTGVLRNASGEIAANLRYSEGRIFFHEPSSNQVRGYAEEAAGGVMRFYRLNQSGEYVFEANEAASFPSAEIFFPPAPDPGANVVKNDAPLPSYTPSYQSSGSTYTPPTSNTPSNNTPTFPSSGSAAPVPIYNTRSYSTPTYKRVGTTSSTFYSR